MSTQYPNIAIDSFTTKIDNEDDVMAAHVNNLQDAVTAIETLLGKTVDNLPDTSVMYFLKHASGAFRNHVHDGTSDDGIKLALATSFSDITISSIANNQLLRYNSSSGKWENVTQTYNLDSLSDVAISGAVTRQSIYYDGTDWHNGYPNAVYA
jgi:hypothetical protein